LWPIIEPVREFSYQLPGIDRLGHEIVATRLRAAFAHILHGIGGQRQNGAVLSPLTAPYPREPRIRCSASGVTRVVISAMSTTAENM